MWFFMISAYILSIISFFMLCLMMIQGYSPQVFLPFPPLVFLIYTCIVYFFTETLIIFFFVGTGVSVRDYSKDNNLSDEYRKKSLAITYKLYPPTMLNLLFMIILFVLPGAVHTGKFPWAWYQYYFVFCLWHFVYTTIIQHQCFRDNTENILAMSGITRKT